LRGRPRGFALAARRSPLVPRRSETRSGRQFVA
jgi:hypothetical protein